MKPGKFHLRPAEIHFENILHVRFGAQLGPRRCYIQLNLALRSYHVGAMLALLRPTNRSKTFVQDDVKAESKEQSQKGAFQDDDKTKFKERSQKGGSLYSG